MLAGLSMRCGPLNRCSHNRCIDDTNCREAIQETQLLAAKIELQRGQYGN